MSATKWSSRMVAERSSLAHLSRQSQRGLARIAERGVAYARRDVGRLLDRTQLRIHAWVESLDPTTPEWIEQAKAERSTRQPEEIREELQERIQQVQDRLA